MKKHFFFFLFLISSFLAAAQTYNYIGVEDGLSNRRVYAIQKGPKGYMWFLTHDGIDRYNGKEFKHYKLIDEPQLAVFGFAGKAMGNRQARTRVLL